MTTRCFELTLRLTSHSLEELYACIKNISSYLCNENECVYPETKAWLVAGGNNCLVEVATPKPLQQVTGSGLLPAAIYSLIRVTCTDARETIREAKDILRAVSGCRGVGLVLANH